MKTLWIFSLLLFSLWGEAQEYVIRYQTLTSGTIFHVETSSGERVGKVVREQVKGQVFYTFVDKEEKIVAKGHSERLKADTVVMLSDTHGENIGGFSAEIYNLYPTEYKIYTPGRKLIARAFMNWLGNSFALTDPDNAKSYLVTFLRPRFKLFNDNWHFQIHVSGVIDMRILCVLGAFQTACDLKFEAL